MFCPVARPAVPTVSSFGLDYVFGLATGTTVSNGGSEHVESGGTASFTIVSRGGQQDELSSGTAIGTTVSSGGHQVVLSGGHGQQYPRSAPAAWSTSSAWPAAPW